MLISWTPTDTRKWAFEEVVILSEAGAKSVAGFCGGSVLGTCLNCPA